MPHVSCQKAQVSPHLLSIATPLADIGPTADMNRCDGVKPKCHHCSRRNEDSCVYDTVLRRRGPGKKNKSKSGSSGEQDETVSPRDEGRFGTGPGSKDGSGPLGSRFEVSTERS